MDWNDFSKRLTLELSRLPVKSFLIVQGPSGLPYVQAMRSEGVLDAEAVGSAFLPRPLAPRQERRLRTLGWERPDEEERKNWWDRFTWRDRGGRATSEYLEACAMLAGQMVGAFRDVYGIESPLELVYQASKAGPDGGPLALPGLGIPLAVPEDERRYAANAARAARPSGTALETALTDARESGDQHGYLEILARATLYLPSPGEPTAAGHQFATAQFGDGTFVLAFTSPEAMDRSLQGQAVHHREATLAELARHWPHPEWQLAVNPGLPSACYLDAKALLEPEEPRKPATPTPPFPTDVHVAGPSTRGRTRGVKPPRSGSGRRTPRAPQRPEAVPGRPEASPAAAAPPQAPTDPRGAPTASRPPARTTPPPAPATPAAAAAPPSPTAPLPTAPAQAAPSQTTASQTAAGQTAAGQGAPGRTATPQGAPGHAAPTHGAPAQATPPRGAPSQVAPPRPPTPPQRPMERPISPAERPVAATQQPAPAQPTAPTPRPQNLTPRPEAPTTRPQDPDTRPHNPSTRPQDSGTRPLDRSTRPADPSTRPLDPGTRPQNPGTRPHNPSTRPQDSGTRSHEPGTRPPGAAAPHQAPVPQPPAAAPRPPAPERRRAETSAARETPSDPHGLPVAPLYGQGDRTVAAARRENVPAEQPGDLGSADAARDGASQVVVMQKVIRPEHVQHYLEGGYDLVAGYVHRLQDVGEIRSPAAVIRALGLMYEGSPFTHADEQIFVIRWPAVKPALFRRPLGGIDEWSMGIIPGGWVIERAPFPGSGYAPGDGPAIPEFKIESQRLPHGAELYRLDARGAEALVAEYDADLRRWLVKLPGGRG